MPGHYRNTSLNGVDVIIINWIMNIDCYRLFISQQQVGIPQWGQTDYVEYILQEIIIIITPFSYCGYY